MLRGVVTWPAAAGPAARINQGESMAISEILASIDRDIAQLQQARVLLGGAPAVAKMRAGRPRKAAVETKKGEATASATAKPAKKKKRNLSPEGRKRIAEAVKKRWAAQKAGTAK
jgi:hypothetical protein